MKNLVNIIFGFSLGVVMILTTSESKDLAEIDASTTAVVDTLNISDSSCQIIKYDNNRIISINFFDKTKNKLNKVSDQEILFYPNGVIKNIKMINGIRLEDRGDYQQYVYQNNLINFSESGILINGRFMDAFEVISEFPEKKK